MNQDPFAVPTPGTKDAFLALKQAPKWLRRPIGATFGFGGKLLVFSNKAAAAGGPAAVNVGGNVPQLSGHAMGAVPRACILYNVSTEPVVLQRAQELEQTIQNQTLQDFCESRLSQGVDRENWAILGILLGNDVRLRFMEYLGFDREENSMEKLGSILQKFTLGSTSPPKFQQPLSPVKDDIPLPSEKLIDVHSEPSMIQHETSAGSVPRLPSGTLDSFFGKDTINTANFFDKPDFPHSQPLPARTSMVPTEGQTSPAKTGATSPGKGIFIQTKKPQKMPFKLHPANGANSLDIAVTRALVLGDFPAAVAACIEANRFADALIFAISGGHELLLRTQEDFFARRAADTSYLRLTARSQPRRPA